MYILWRTGLAMGTYRMTKPPKKLHARIADLEKRNAELEEELRVTTQAMALAAKVAMDTIKELTKLIEH